MLLSLIARLIHQSHRMEERIMAKIDDLSAAIDALIADQQQFIADVESEITTLLANTGPNTSQFDALLGKVASAKAALDTADAAVKTPEPAPAAPVPAA